MPRVRPPGGHMVLKALPTVSHKPFWADFGHVGSARPACYNPAIETARPCPQVNCQGSSDDFSRSSGYRPGGLPEPRWQTNRKLSGLNGRARVAICLPLEEWLAQKATSSYGSKCSPISGRLVAANSQHWINRLFVEGDKLYTLLRLLDKGGCSVAARVLEDVRFEASTAAPKDARTRVCECGGSFFAVRD